MLGGRRDVRQGDARERPASAALANALAARSMAFLEKHHEALQARELSECAGAGSAVRGGALHEEDGDASSVLFRDRFLNSNPILMEYMAQAALDEAEAVEGVAGRVDGEVRRRAGDGNDDKQDYEHDADCEIKFINIQSQGVGERGTRRRADSSEATKKGAGVAHLPVGERGAGWEEEGGGGKGAVDDEEACLSRSETSRPRSNMRRTGSFAADLRQVASTMSGEVPHVGS